MEDLLASIRKAIQDDIGDKREVQEPEERAPQAAHINDIRSRIRRNRTMGEFTRPAAAEPRQPSTPAAGFAGILGGKTARQTGPPLALRPTFDREKAADYEAQDYGDPPVEADYGFVDPAYAGHGGDTGQSAGDDGSYGTDPAMMSPETSAAANAAFGRLAEALVGRTLGDRPVEDVAREMLRGMLKEWLDENLPALVEQLVREEIERVARRGR